MEKFVHLDEDIICLDVDKKTNEDVITYMFEKMKKKNYVKESFLKAVLSREKVYSTGLPLENMGVAIPHTDPEHVNIPTVGVAVLREPVTFQMMGNPSQAVEVEIVFILAIKDPNKQLTMLEKLMEMFQNNDEMFKLKNAREKAEIYKILDNKFNF
ncbi:PTS sugar transporter subunit IIA [Aeribacillus composti]|uniref:PTS sugar transporter subunit IIA n=1 Tax=Aeribacillus composti TaxID=1868734 RepID=UPI002E239945|nr:PTS sugar transporter subunit IIA [Aeribacillus composti]